MEYHCTLYGFQENISRNLYEEEKYKCGHRIYDTRTEIIKKEAFHLIIKALKNDDTKKDLGPTPYSLFK